MKLVLFFLLSITLSFGSSIKSVEILEDNPQLSFKNIQQNTNFKKTKHSLKRRSNSNYWIKIKIDEKKLLKEKAYILRVHSRLGINSFNFDKNIKRDYFDEDIIYLDQENLKEIYCKVNNHIGFVDVLFEVYDKKAYLESYFNKMVFYGLAYGIIFSAFLYYLAFYIFNREKSFIYYSLTQLSMLLMLAMPSKFDTIPLVAVFVFSNLFTKEFLSTKDYTPKLDKLLTFMIYFYIFDFLIGNSISDKFPTSIFLLVYLVAAIIIYSQTKFKPILFYILGWSIIIVSFILIDFQFFITNLLSSFVELNIFIHIVTPLESLILAFALSYKVKLLEEKNLEKERLLIQQNKLAAMGEMISNIAHQWRQPLTHLSYILMNINSAFKHNKLDEAYLLNKTNAATNQLKYMSNTIDDFRNFYLPKTSKTEFSVKKAIDNALTIVHTSLKENSIPLKITGEDFKINNYESEFSQVILNLISNAKDALIENHTKNPEINIIIEQNKLIIKDNAGGIAKKIKDKIFEPYFTTKPKGSGIGLYMSKIIIEKHFNATLTHQNCHKGSCFIIQL